MKEEQLVCTGVLTFLTALPYFTGHRSSFITFINIRQLSNVVNCDIGNTCLARGLKQSPAGVVRPTNSLKISAKAQ